MRWERLAGLIAAPHTPMADDGSINPAAIEDQAHLFHESGLHGVFICGSTGEGHSLSVTERLEIAEHWAKGAAGKLRLIVHVGHNSLPEARALAAHALRIGADAVGAMAPFGIKPEGVQDLIAYFAAVAGAAPGLPFYFYDVPGVTGVTVPLAKLLDHAAERIPTFAGVKYSREDMMTFQEGLAAHQGAFDMCWGIDEVLLGALALGARSAIGSTYGYAAPLYHRIWRAFEAGDLATARREQAKSVALVRVLLDFGVLRAGKAMMSLLGVDCGPVRAPARRMTGDELHRLYDRMRGFDVFPRPLALP